MRKQHPRRKRRAPPDCLAAALAPPQGVILVSVLVLPLESR